MSTLPDYTKRIPRDWFARDTATVARELVGAIMLFKPCDDSLLSVRIVETEAYLAENDLACHASKRQTPRNAPMFGAGGILYVYSIYGIHKCANIVTEGEGRGCAVLLRAAEPLNGIDHMLQRRDVADHNRLLQGPGNLSKGLGLDLSHNYLSCESETLWFQAAPEAVETVTTTRIGINQSVDLPLRFYLKGSKAVSGKRY